MHSNFFATDCSSPSHKRSSTNSFLRELLWSKKDKKTGMCWPSANSYQLLSHKWTETAFSDFLHKLVIKHLSQTSSSCFCCAYGSNSSLTAAASNRALRTSSTELMRYNLPLTKKKNSVSSFITFCKFGKYKAGHLSRSSRVPGSLFTPELTLWGSGQGTEMAMAEAGFCNQLIIFFLSI